VELLSSDSAPKRSYTSFFGSVCYCSTSVGRPLSVQTSSGFWLLGGGGTRSWLTLSLRMSCEGVERYLGVIRLISSLTNGILESVWSGVVADIPWCVGTPFSVIMGTKCSKSQLYVLCAMRWNS
jgi:hypothetical protein